MIEPMHRLWFRKLVLASGTFGVVALLFLVYDREVAGSLDSTHDRSMTPTAAALRALDVSGRRALLIGDPWRIGNGTEASGVWFDSDTRRRVLEFEAGDWQSDDQQRLHVRDARIRMRLADGRRLSAQADQIVLDKPLDAAGRRPTSGTMHGNVRITLEPRLRPHDGATPTDAAAHLAVTLQMEDVSFDLDLCSLQSRGAFRLESPELSVAGTGARLVWDQTAGCVDQFTIVQGESIEVRGRRLAKLWFELEGSSSAVQHDRGQPRADGRPTTDTAPDDWPTELDGERVLVLLDADDLAAVGRTPVRYRATFAGDARASRRSHGREIASLVADAIDVRFDVEPMGADDPTSAWSASPVEDPDGLSVAVEWTGSLTARRRSPPPAAAVRTAYLSALGSPVRLCDADGAVACAQLSYDGESDEVRMTGSAECPVELFVAGEETQITARALIIDGRRGVVRVDGPGELVQYAGFPLELGPAAPVRLRWEREMRANVEAFAPGAPWIGLADRMRGVEFDGGVVISSTPPDGSTLAELTADELIVDLHDRSLSVPGTSRLRFEDRRLPAIHPVAMTVGSPLHGALQAALARSFAFEIHDFSAALRVLNDSAGPDSPPFPRIPARGAAQLIHATTPAPNFGPALARALVHSRPELHETPADFGYTYESFEIVQSDGGAVRGWLIPATTPRDRTVVFHEGNAFNRSYYARHARLFVENGYNLVLYDYRGFGDAPGRYDFGSLLSDGLAVHEWARERLGGRFVAMGASLGGPTALHAALRADEVVGLVLDSPFVAADLVRNVLAAHPDLHFDAALVAAGDEVILSQFPPSYDLARQSASLTVPVLVIQGMQDVLTPASGAKKVHDAAPEPKTIWLTECTHGNAINEQPVEYERRLVEFLDCLLWE